MKYRIRQDSYGGWTWHTPQKKYAWWPFWFNLSWPQDSYGDAFVYIESHKKGKIYTQVD